LATTLAATTLATSLAAATLATAATAATAPAAFGMGFRGGNGGAMIGEIDA
jgi:Spy/CpxP family protein refolding chaperone